MPYFLVLILFILLSGCSSQEKSSHSSNSGSVVRSVKTVVIDDRKEPQGQYFPGVVDAANKADLAFRVGGKVIELLVSEGGSVNEGDIIARLDAIDYQIRLTKAKAQYVSASGDYERAKRLLVNQVISKSELDKLKAANDSAKAELDDAQQLLSYTELKAPFSGVVAKRHIELYEEANAHQTVISLHDLSTLNINLNVPESVMINIKRNNEERVAYAMFDSIKNERFSLHFKEIETVADSATKTFGATFTMVAPANHYILPGMSVKVFGEYKQSEINDNKHKTNIPLQAIMKRSDTHFVYTVNNLESGIGIVGKRNVKIGELTEYGVQIGSAFEPATHIIVAGLQHIALGQKVKVQTAAQ